MAVVTRRRNYETNGPTGSSTIVKPPVKSTTSSSETSIGSTPTVINIDPPVTTPAPTRVSARLAKSKEPELVEIKKDLIQESESELSDVELEDGVELELEDEEEDDDGDDEQDGDDDDKKVEIENGKMEIDAGADQKVDIKDSNDNGNDDEGEDSEESDESDDEEEDEESEEEEVKNETELSQSNNENKSNEAIPTLKSSASINTTKISESDREIILSPPSLPSSISRRPSHAKDPNDDKLMAMCIQVLKQCYPKGLTIKQIDEQIVETMNGYEDICKSSTILSTKLNSFYRRCHPEGGELEISFLIQNCPIIRYQSPELPRRLVYKWADKEDLIKERSNFEQESARIHEKHQQKQLLKQQQVKDKENETNETSVSSITPGRLTPPVDVQALTPTTTTHSEHEHDDYGDDDDDDDDIDDDEEQEIQGRDNKTKVRKVIDNNSSDSDIDHRNHRRYKSSKSKYEHHIGQQPNLVHRLPTPPPMSASSPPPSPPYQLRRVIKRTPHAFTPPVKRGASSSSSSAESKSKKLKKDKENTSPDNNHNQKKHVKIAAPSSSTSSNTLSPSISTGINPYYDIEPHVGMSCALEGDMYSKAWLWNDININSSLEGDHDVTSAIFDDIKSPEDLNPEDLDTMVV